MECRRGACSRLRFGVSRCFRPLRPVSFELSTSLSPPVTCFSSFQFGSFRRSESWLLANKAEATTGCVDSQIGFEWISQGRNFERPDLKRDLSAFVVFPFVCFPSLRRRQRAKGDILYIPIHSQIRKCVCKSLANWFPCLHAYFAARACLHAVDRCAFFEWRLCGHRLPAAPVFCLVPRVTNGELKGERNEKDRKRPTRVEPKQKARGS